MTTHSNLAHLNLEYYRKQAKKLLKATRAGDADALARLAAVSRRVRAEDYKLHEAQLAIARGEGFASWPKFQAVLTESKLNYQEMAKGFVDAATSDLRRATKLLVAHPELARAGIWVALVLGDVAAVKEVLGRDSEFAKRKGGPDNFEPLIYVCFSRFGNRASGRSDGLIETARLLLKHGAHASASFTPADLPGNPLSCLYAATGLNNNPQLALLLLEAGANPNDGESLYHSTEHAGLECTKLLLRFGARVAGSNALNHMLDREDPGGVRLLLDAGGDPGDLNHRGETSLHWAVYRRRSLPVVEMLLERGAPLDVRRKDGRTTYALAMQSGQKETAALLRARGANTELNDIDALVAAWADGDENLRRATSEALREKMRSPENAKLLPDLAQNHATDSVRALLDAGVPIDSRGDMGETALHWACWKGFADLAKLLVERGASLTIKDAQYHGTPPGWFGHGIRNNGEGGDYAGVARVLVAARAKFSNADVPTGKDDVDAVLARSGHDP
ncbi:MAG TPA: ankyrin repeat domain-containing protein [Candidatus Sulfotelmatobacter sp.]|nr:ankyrin repeat domain-containing protein [Candidatus Sulfotelmatobacter sp.]